MRFSKRTHTLGSHSSSAGDAQRGTGKHLVAHRGNLIVIVHYWQFSVGLYVPYCRLKQRPQHRHIFNALNLRCHTCTTSGN